MTELIKLEMGPGVLNLMELDDLLSQADGLSSCEPGWPWQSMSLLPWSELLSEPYKKQRRRPCLSGHTEHMLCTPLALCFGWSDFTVACWCFSFYDRPCSF